MDDRGLRYRIITSSVTSIVALAVAIILWLASGNTASLNSWGGLAVTITVAYILLEMNTRNALLRVRSKMVSSTFLVLAGTLTFLHPLSYDYLPEVCWAAALMVFFMCYQKHLPQAYMFHVFLFLSIGSLVFPKMLLFAPFFMFSAIVQMRALTPRAFMAALIGIILPLALREAYLILTGESTMLYGFWEQLTRFTQPDYTVIDEHRLVSFATVAILAISAMVHFAYTKFNDKIRTRMLYYTILIEELAITAMLAACPGEFDTIFRLFVLNSTPLIAHHLAFAGGKAGDIYFYTAIALIGLLAAYNISGINFGLWEILHNI